MAAAKHTWGRSYDASALKLCFFVTPKPYLLIARRITQQTENGERRTENGERRTENGERRTENGERRTENGERRTENNYSHRLSAPAAVSRPLEPQKRGDTGCWKSSCVPFRPSRCLSVRPN